MIGLLRRWFKGKAAAPEPLLQQIEEEQAALEDAVAGLEKDVKLVQRSNTAIQHMLDDALHAMKRERKL